MNTKHKPIGAMRAAMLLFPGQAANATSEWIKDNDSGPGVIARDDLAFLEHTAEIIDRATNFSALLESAKALARLGIETCPRCGGDGAASQPNEACPQCGGTGKDTFQPHPDEIMAARRVVEATTEGRTL